MSLWSLSWLGRALGPNRPAGRVAACHIIALPKHLPLPVSIHDLSAKSLGLVSDVAIENGSFLAVTLEGTRGFRRFVRACVVHATPRPDGDWVLNCEFVHHLTSEELTAFL